MQPAHLTLIGKPGCHLCDDARDVVESVVGKLADDPSAPPVVLDERSILDDPDLHARFVEDIPVLLINGTVHNYWRIDPVRLRTALLELA
ncbi:glutaredoxin family protein [Cryobacterium tepidiphilum]|uniref:Glutaredoxin family protein n=1 Tax=Cryobacterium tepidiphilum TaxID=2486026 RepID=A0A3M8LC69_9MICO|nr:glutaredoxin family protein [Cryobacterium tepidiphilum]RNE62088.1 glutaredoxin family protein [Cryobacterium tepidiphilum]